MLYEYLAPLMVTAHGMNPCNVTNAFCHRMPALNASCCANQPPITLVQTHEWNRDPIDGPAETWTLRTSWTDMEFSRACDPSRALADVSKTMFDWQMDDVISDMHKLWTTPRIPGPVMWADEWNNAGTCIFSLRPECYTSHTPGEEVGNFFDTLMMLYKSRPTFEWLFNEGIGPHWHRDYDYDEFVRPLYVGHGAPVSLKCHHDRVVAVEYAFQLQGCFPYGRYVPVEPPRDHGNCESQQFVRYFPKMREPRNEQEEKEWLSTRRKEPKKMKEWTMVSKRQVVVPTVSASLSGLGYAGTWTKHVPEPTGGSSSGLKMYKRSDPVASITVTLSEPTSAGVLMGVPT